MVARKELWSLHLQKGTLIPSWGFYPHDPTQLYSSKTQTASTYTLGIMASMLELEGMQNSVYSNQ
jgi:hypothetical protein